MDFESNPRMIYPTSFINVYWKNRVIFINILGTNHAQTLRTLSCHEQYIDAEQVLSPTLTAMQ